MKFLRYGAAALIGLATISATMHTDHAPAVDCSSITEAIVSTGNYSPGPDALRCVGEEDDPRAVALLAAHEALMRH